MMRTHTLLILVFACLISCTTKEGNQPVTGAFTLEVVAYHHVVPVPNTEVYLKEEVTQYPGSDLNVYHFMEICDSTGRAFFNDVVPGNHWIYGKGFDGVDSVVGNLPVYVDPKDSDRRVKVILPVSE